MKKPVAYHLFLSALLCSVTLGSAAAAEKPTSINVPAGDLITALKAFTKQTGVEVVYVSSRLAGVKTPGVNGTLLPQDALAKMLQGTTLEVKRDSSGAVLITGGPSAATSSREPPGSSRAEGAEDGIQLAVVEAATTVAAGAGAQEDKSRAAGDKTQETSEIEVISTAIDGLNRRSLFDASEDSALPFNVIDREEIARTGAASVEELFRNIPELSNYGTSAQATTDSAITTGGSAIKPNVLNMRGFGGLQTVILVNGRRQPGAATGLGADIGRIPLASIERIEILPASAGALYGGGAVGGVVNFILRKDFESKELGVYYGAASGGGGEVRMNYLDGHTFNQGRTRLTTTVDYSKREALRMGDRPEYLERAMERYPAGTTTTLPLFGNAFEGLILPALAHPNGTIVSGSPTVALGIPGNPTARYAAMPTGLNDAQSRLLTPASFTATAGTFRRGSRYDRNLLITPEERYGLQFQLEHDLLSEGRLTMYADASWTTIKQHYTSPGMYSAALSATNPLNPFRAANGGPGIPVTIYQDHLDIDDTTDNADREEARITLGLKGIVSPRFQWTVDLSGQRGGYEKASSASDNLLGRLYAEAAANGILPGAQQVAAPFLTRSAVYNPLVDHVMFPTVGANLDPIGYVRNTEYLNRNAELSARAVIQAWDLPAGPLQISPVVDARIDDSWNIQIIDVPNAFRQLTGFITAFGGTPAVPTERSSTEYGGALEVAIPIISSKWRPIPLHLVDLNFSRRLDDSNRSVRATSDTISGRIGIVRDVIFRASLTEGYVPNRFSTDLFNRNPAQNFPSTLRDPARGNLLPVPAGQNPTFEELTGGNPDLRPTSARTRSFGVILTPRFVSGLRIDINYNVTLRFDEVSTPILQDMLNFPDDFPGRVTRAALTASDIQNGFTGGVITSVDRRSINVARTGLKTVDYRINYSIPLAPEFGALDWTVNASNNRTSYTQTRPSGPTVERVNEQGQPLSWRGNSSVFWTKNQFTAGVTGNYINAYRPGLLVGILDLNPGMATVESQLTFDLQLGYRTQPNAIADNLWYSLLNGTEIRVGIQNVLDKAPSFYSDATAFYSRYVNPAQRYGYLQINKNF